MRGRKQEQKSLAELLAMPEAAAISFEPPRLGDLNLADVEQELVTGVQDSESDEPGPQGRSNL